MFPNKIVKSLRIFILFVILIFLYEFTKFGGKKSSSSSSLKTSERIHIAAGFCGNLDRVQKFKTVLYSTILMSESEIEFHLIVEDMLKLETEILYSRLPQSVQKRIIFSYYNIWFPSEDYNWWKQMYRVCTSEKIFFSKIIRQDVDSVLYFDQDTIIVGRVEKIWAKFKEFEPQEILGAIHDCPFPGCGYYSKVAKAPIHVPAVGQSGLNGGVLFMRLDLMRKTKFIERIIHIAKEYKPVLYFAEQDLLNILFSNRTDQLRFIDCSFNYFPHFYCQRGTMCDKRDGIFVLHGAGDFFYNPDFSIAKIYDFIPNLDLNKKREDIFKELALKVNQTLLNTDCQSIIGDIFRY